MSDDRVRQVFFSIARCPNVRAVYDGGGGGCRDIVRDQITKRGAERYEDFQVPEPWVGQIDVAPLLFLSSNPSIGDDDHSTCATSDEIIWEAHHLAFGGGSRVYIPQGRYTIDRDGNWERQQYWCSILRCAQELIPEARPGLDYAITEVVHCKSKNQIGAKAAVPTCVKRHLENVLSIAAARLVAVVGNLAQEQIFGRVVPVGEHPVEMNLGGRVRTVASLAHPTSGDAGKKFATRYLSEDVERLRAALASQPA